MKTPADIIRAMLADLGAGNAHLPSVRAAYDYLEGLEPAVPHAPMFNPPAPVPTTQREWAREMARLRNVRPRPLHILYGPNPAPGQVLAHVIVMREWSTAYRKARHAHKAEMAAGNF